MIKNDRILSIENLPCMIESGVMNIFFNVSDRISTLYMCFNLDEKDQINIVGY